MMPGAAARRRRRGRADDDAARRLEARVAAETAEQRARLAVDATMVDALLRAREPEAASAALEEHQVALRAFADRLHHALADACSERESQARRSRSRALAGAAAAAVASAVLVTTVQPPGAGPDTEALTAVEQQEEQSRLQTAQERLDALRAGSPQNDRPATPEAPAAPEEVVAPPSAPRGERGHAEVLELLDEEQGSLRALPTDLPAVTELLEDAPTLAPDLPLDLDSARPGTTPPPFPVPDLPAGGTPR